MNYFDGPVGFWKLFFHFGIAIQHVGVCSYWAVWLRRKTLTEAWHQQQIDEARQRAEGATAAKSNFLATMSHEIRTPMNGVLGMTTLLRGTPLEPEQREYVETAHRSGQHLLAIINDILDFSKIEAGRMDVVRANFDPRAALDEVRELLATEARHKGLEFSTAVASDVPAQVLADGRMVRQVLINLVGNALKYTSTGFVRVEVTWAITGEEAGQLRVAVRDSGIGIDSVTLERLFTEFTQADTSTTRRFGGTGLGLAISRRMAELMGGAIAVDSAPGVGSTFTLTLPATIVAAAPARQASRIPALPTVAGGGPRVLVAEDNHVNQVVVVRLLERQGCQVDVAANGRDAVESYSARAYDLVLMDCYMPEMDGFEATTRMRALDTGTRTPIVALTASVLDSDRRRCVEAGMDEVLAKPIEADVLAEAVRRWTAKEVVTTASATSTLPVSARR